MDEFEDLVFHITENGLMVSVKGEMANADQIDRIALVLNFDPDVQSLIKTRVIDRTSRTTLKLPDSESQAT